MRLSTIDALDSFALLGAGFSRAGFVLVSPLAPTREAPCVVFAPYENRGGRAERFTGDIRALPALEADLPAGPFEVALNASGHREGVAAIRDAIASGDVYQVNLTLRARVRCASGGQLLARLLAQGPPRFAAWVRLPGGAEFVSASPELLFESEGGRIRCEPMKGTAGPGAARELSESAKDASELAMITDLVRHDLTPVCAPRTVRVVCERRTVRLPYAVQTVSDVEGLLLDGVGPLEALDALHPGGSVTGAPKRAAMRMIGSLEGSRRGAYCGALGFLTPRRACFSLLIRTAQRDAGDWIYGVGGGIVWESDPDRELEEIHVKLGWLR